MRKLGKEVFGKGKCKASECRCLVDKQIWDLTNHKQIRFWLAPISDESG